MISERRFEEGFARFAFKTIEGLCFYIFLEQKRMIGNVEAGKTEYCMAVIDPDSGMLFEFFGIYGDPEFHSHQIGEYKITDILQPGRGNMGIDQYHLAKEDTGRVSFPVSF